MAVDENAFFREAMMRICGHLKIEDAMASSLEYFVGFMPADYMFLQLYEHGAGAMRTIAKATLEGGTRVDQLTPLPTEAQTAVENWNPSAPLDVTILNDPTLHPLSREMLKDHGISSASVMVML
ncbi:MAG: sigma-54-dependent Fis family transcriptional regulator, partial [Spirochaetia bacterium]